MKDVHELRLAAKVARMYYKQKMKQTDIAKMMGISQSTTSRLLKTALNKNIIQISIQAPVGSFLDLEEELVNKFGHLKEAIVVDCEADDEEIIMDRLGEAGAFYLSSIISSGDIVGISSWSKTLLKTIDNLEPNKKIGGKIVQILGGTGSPQVQIHATHMITRFCNLFGAEGYFLPANAVAPSVAAKKALLSDVHIRSAMSLFSQIDIALMGVGDVHPSGLLAQSGNILSEETLTDLKKKGAVGDFCLRFFDSEGRRVSKELCKRVIGISLDELKKVPKVVVVAGGKRKVDAVKGGLLSGCCDVLITDKYTARRLLDNK